MSDVFLYTSHGVCIDVKFSSRSSRTKILPFLCWAIHSFDALSLSSSSFCFLFFSFIFHNNIFFNGLFGLLCSYHRYVRCTQILCGHIQHTHTHLQNNENDKENEDILRQFQHSARQIIY